MKTGEYQKTNSNYKKTNFTIETQNRMLKMSEERNNKLKKKWIKVI